MNHFLFIHSSVSDQFGCFHIMGNVNSAAVNLGCICLFDLWFSLDIYPGVELLDHMVALFLVL